VRSFRSLVIVLCVALLASCAPTRQPRGEVTTSGFLKDYSILEPGKDDQAKLRYVNPHADFSQYQAVIVDSVTMWSGPKLSKLDPKVKQALVDSAYTSLVTTLGKSFTITKVPGHGTIRLRAAITEATSSAVVPDLVATVIPQVRLLATLGGLAADSALTVGEAQGEIEATDSLTDELLGAAVDKRIGQRSIQGVFSKWSDVEDAWEYWAELTRMRLVEAGAGHAPAPEK
jgi:Protein of unknown function (DUF3313)